MQTVSHTELKTIIKESVKEALEDELIKFRVDTVDFRGNVYK